MELKREGAAKFVVQQKFTEKKLLHLEKGIRTVGFKSGGKQMLTTFFVASLICVLLKILIKGFVGNIFATLGAIAFMAFISSGYALFRGWQDAKKQVHEQIKNGEIDLDTVWEYRFHDDCYEIIGKHEMSMVKYENVTRLLDMSGMLVLVEKGSPARYFMKKEVVRGGEDRISEFLERKCKVTMEKVTVR
ncbi:MAG: hypothetical protein IJO55_10545 [Lachnospiraceae bacterium]|nr:hypothetical protein [Lachnospiraceae bacterium]